MITVELFTESEGEMRSAVLEGPTELPRGMSESTSARRRGVLVVPLRHCRTAAAMVVPDEDDARVHRNRVAVPAGVVVLEHGDRVTFEGRDHWIAVTRRASDVPYEPAVHGEGLFCALSRARVAQGEPIVCCPGPAGGSCDLRVRAEVWRKVIASGRYRCPGCGYDPAAESFRPPRPRRERRRRIDAAIHRILGS